MPIPTWLGANKIFSGSGHQYIWGTLGNDLIKDTSGNDTIVGDPLYAMNFSTFSESSEGGEYCYEIGGNDTIKAGSGNDLIYGDSVIEFIPTFSLETSIFEYSPNGGNDVIKAGSGNDTIYGDTEYLFPEWPEETTEGGEGSARLTVQGDSYEGGETQGGNDTIYGESGNDVVYAGGGKDTVYGGTGDDLLFGGAGCDYLNGDGGNDTIFADGGFDTLDGGISGLDTFVFTCETDGALIKGFQKGGVDKIDLSEFYGLDFNDLTITTSGGTSTVYVPEAGGFEIIVEKVIGLTASSFVFDI